MIAFIALLIMLVDQGTKYIVQQYMELGQTIAVIPNVFHFTYILNPGAAFGLFPYHLLKQSLSSNQIPVYLKRLVLFYQ